MAALTATNPTLLDLAKALGPDGKISPVNEILNQVSDILEDITWIQGNRTTGHQYSQRTGLPTPTVRKINQGVNPTKARQIQVTDDTTMLVDYAEFDKKLVDLSGDKEAYLLQQSRAHIEGFNQKIASLFFTGNSGSQPEAFTGLGPRYNSLSAANAENIIVGGGGGADNGSIWLIGWSPITCCGIVPKNGTVGLQMEDKGVVTIEDASNGSNSGRMEAYRLHFSMDAGLAVPDWRYAVRIPNIDKSDLKTDRSSGANLPDLMYQALEQIPNLGLVRPAFYMSRSMRSMVRRQMTDGTKNSTLQIENVGGKMLMQFDGVPMRRVDALAADEALVS